MIRTNAATTDLQVVWFKRDLRTQDHEALARAAAAGPTLPLLIIEPDYWRQPDVSYRHYAYLRMCAEDLQAQLTDLGAQLSLYVGDAVEVLQGLMEKQGHFMLWSHQETGNQWTYDRDERVRAFCRGTRLSGTSRCSLASGVDRLSTVTVGRSVGTR